MCVFKERIHVFKRYVKLLQLCLTLCDAMDCSSPDSSVHGILQARILEWVAMPSSRGSSQPRDQTAPPALQADPLPLSHRGSPCICVHFTKSHKAKSLNGLGEWPVQPVVLGYRRLLNACHGFHLTTNLRSVYFFLKSFIYLLWLCWVVVAMWGFLQFRWVGAAL